METIAQPQGVLQQAGMPIVDTSYSDAAQGPMRLPDKEAWAYQVQFNRCCNAKRTTSLAEYKKCDEFYHDIQWDPEEKTKADNKGQYVVTINRIRKAIQSMTGMLNADKPMFKSYPMGKEDTVVSDIVNKVFAYIYKNSAGVATSNRILKNSLIKMAYAHVKQNDLNQTVFECLGPENVVPDVDCTDPFFRDAQVIYIVKWVNTKIVSQVYNIPEEELCLEQPEEWGQFTDAKGNAIPLGQIADEAHTYVKVVEGYHRVVMKERFADSGADTGRARVRIEKKTLLGYRHLYKEILPDTISKHNIIPLYFDDTGNVYKRGLVHYLIELQIFLNKAFGIMLLNAQLTSNPKIVVHEDAVPKGDIKKLEQNWAIPGKVIVVSGEGKEAMVPQVISGQQLSSAWYQIVMMLMQEMEYNTISHQHMGMDINGQGKDNTKIFQSYQLALNSMREFLNIYEGFYSSTGEVLLQYFFTFTPQNVIAKILELDEVKARMEEYKNVGFNPNDVNSVNAFQKQAYEKGMNPYETQQMMIRAKKDVVYLKKITDIMSSKSFIDFDIMVEKGSYLSSHSQLRLAMKMELYDKGLVDNQAVLEDAPLENKDEIIQRLSMIHQLTQRNNEIEEALTQAENRIKMLEEAITKGKIDMSTIEYEAKAAKQLAQTRAKDSADKKINAMRSKLVLTQDRAAQQNEVDKAILELKTAIAKVNIEKEKLSKGGKAIDEYRITDAIDEILNMDEFKGE